MKPDEDDWKPIETAPCDDRFARIRWRNGSETTEDLDHDSDPDWWRERGAVSWRPATEDEERDVW